MDDLSMHIQDICENSLIASPKLIELDIIENKDFIQITIIDDGKGMSSTLCETVKSPFTTTRTVRKVGLGIPLFIQTCEQTGGFVHLTSKEQHGTTISGRMYKNHIDAIPLGDLVETVYLLLINDQNINIKFKYNNFNLNLQEIKEILNGVPLTTKEVQLWLKAYIQEGINENLENK